MMKAPKPRGGPSSTSTRIGSRGFSSKTSLAGTGAVKKMPCKPDKPLHDEATFTLPAFSVPLPKKKTSEFTELEKMKKKMIRRNKPVGEDIPKMKEIIKELRGRHITVQEFVGLIAPSTGDNGELIRLNLAEELSTFRTAARKIYETMTQDVSDVLTNEHIQLTESNQERQQIYNDKMRRNMNQVFQLIPDFDFEKFYLCESYLAEKFPLAPIMDSQDEEMQAILRQEAYHRYQWLKSEGERLKQENMRLQDRLHHLKKQQRQEILAVAEREKRAETERGLLVETQVVLQDRLEELSTSLEQSIVDAELETEKMVAAKKSSTKDMAENQQIKPPGPSRTEWATIAAAELEAEQIEKTVKSQSSRVSMRMKQSQSRTTIKGRAVRAGGSKKGRDQSMFKTPPRHTSTPKPPSPFHYSPPKTPPASATSSRPQSPFHYSPPKTPPEYYSGGCGASNDGAGYDPGAGFSSHRVRLETANTTTVMQPQAQQQSQQQQQQQPQQPSSSAPFRARAPSDTWGGFY